MRINLIIVDKEIVMTVDGAIVREQGVTFAIVIVKPSAMSNSSVAAETRTAFQAQIRDFQGIPLILASQDSRGVFEYQGRDDIVRFLASIDHARIPWKRYTIS
jgi:hypothetical protein